MDRSGGHTGFSPPRSVHSTGDSTSLQITSSSTPDSRLPRHVANPAIMVRATGRPVTRSSGSGQIVDLGSLQDVEVASSCSMSTSGASERRLEMARKKREVAEAKRAEAEARRLEREAEM